MQLCRSGGSVARRCGAADAAAAAAAVLALAARRGLALAADPYDKRAPLPGVHSVVAVASGKGGVGKSTTAVNVAVAAALQGAPHARALPAPPRAVRRRAGALHAHRARGSPRPQLLPTAPALAGGAAGCATVGGPRRRQRRRVRGARAGLRVGLLDADVYGPSVPLLMGVHGPPSLDGEGRMLPHVAHGVRCMSMGFLLKPGAAAAWRGPMVMGALGKLIGGTAWGPLDVLVVDCPPGTGDAHITLSQRLPLAGALIVSTPQEMALVDARRGVDLYRQVGVPVLGMVENMAYLLAPAGAGAAPGAWQRIDVFGRGGVARAAAEAGCELLGEVPLMAAVRTGSDSGVPVAATAPPGAAGAPGDVGWDASAAAAGAVYHSIAAALARKLGL